MSEKHPLVGRPIAYFAKLPQVGRCYGIVRSVTLWKTPKARRGEIRSVVVQRPGGGAQEATSYSARCQGKRHRLDPEQLVSVQWHGRMRPVAEFIRSRIKAEETTD